MTQSTEPPYTCSVCTVVWEEGQRELSPYPDLLVVSHGRATVELNVLYLAHTITLAMRNVFDYMPKCRNAPSSCFLQKS